MTSKKAYATLSLNDEDVRKIIYKHKEIKLKKIANIEKCKKANENDFERKEYKKKRSQKIARPPNSFMLFSNICGRLLKETIDKIYMIYGVENRAKRILTQKLCSILWMDLEKSEKELFRSFA